MSNTEALDLAMKLRAIANALRYDHRGGWGAETVGPINQAADALAHQPAASGEPVAWVRVIDEALVGSHLDVADQADDYATAKRKLNNLLSHEQSIGAYFAAQPAPAPACAYGSIADLRDAKWLDPQCADRGACQSLLFKAAQPAPALVPPAPFLFIAMDDDKRAHLTWCADEAAVREATKGAMFWLQPGEELSAEHADELDGWTDELLDSGAAVFEGDPPLYLYRVAAAPSAPQSHPQR